MRRTRKLLNLRRWLAGALALAAMLPAFTLPLAAQASGQKKASAKSQFERAEKLRTALQGKPQQDRTLREYQQLVNTFRRVYLITPHAVDVPAALLAVAETYQEMGRQFDAKYYQSAIDAYQFLLHEYPASRYRMDALFTIAQIQQTDLGKPDAAELTYQEYIRRFPQSPRVEQARRALTDIAADREAQKKAAAVAASAPSSGGAPAAGKTPQVLNIRYWNADNFTRVVVDLEDSMQWRAERIANPDRIFFDLHKARLSSTLAGKTFTVEDGFLKMIRVAPNQVGVVRVVLEVEKVKDYSVFMLPNPYRLVVDVYGERVSLAKAEPPAQPKAESSAPAKKAAPEKAAESAKVEKTAAKKAASGSETASTNAAAAPPQPAQPKSDGTHSLTRALGLKIGRIVIDPGHGGHDTGTIGPTGLMEKELCLDIAQRLGKTIKEEMPWVEVHYTREDDTFIPLENRTALANQLKADMFISIHANSSRDRGARGIETYYLSFASSDEALEVAARENALAQSSIHELQDILKQIARNEKIEESRELAQQVQEGLAGRMQRYSRYLKNRGVKKAPFIVLIGANMPSVLTEISFLSNPSDEAALKKPEHRDRVVEGIFKGVSSYLTALGSVAYNPPKSDQPDR
jgi:N-acetylmuramoyl-L-alanine amidase